MKRLKKTKLPKWVISGLPFKKEDETVSSIIVPLILFFIMGTGFLLYMIHHPQWIIIEILLTVMLFLALFLSVWWFLAQVNALRICRKELMLRYKLADDPEKKEEIKEELKKLYVFVE